MATRAQLVDRALRILGVVPPPASAEDAALVDSLVDGLLDELAARGIAAIANRGSIADSASGDIPAAAWQPIATILALRSAPDFADAVPTDLAALSIEAEVRLRAMSADEDSGEPLKVRFY